MTSNSSSKDLYYHYLDLKSHGHIDFLKWAAREGYEIPIRYLLENDFVGNFFKTYALLVASQYGHLHIVKYLVEHGAHVNSEINGLSPLSLAAKYGHLDTVRYLVENGANIHLYNHRAVRLAHEYGHLNVENYLRSILGPSYAHVTWDIIS